MIVFFLGLFLVLLAFKLVLGMVLLKFARNRYKGMKKAESQSQSQSQTTSQPTQTNQQGQSKDGKETYSTEGKRVGPGGVTEVDDDKKRWIFEDDKETLRGMREKEGKWREKSERMGLQEFGKIGRYDMVKRIW